MLQNFFNQNWVSVAIVHNFTHEDVICLTNPLSVQQWFNMHPTFIVRFSTFALVNTTSIYYPVACSTTKILRLYRPFFITMFEYLEMYVSLA